MVKNKPLYNSITPPLVSNCKKQAHEELLKELYKENQSFLNKAIFTISTLAIPFLFEILSRRSEDFNSTCLMIISLFTFCGVILLQVSSLRNARDGCDLSLEGDDDKKSQGENLFELARVKDIWRECCFAIALILTASALVIKTLN